MMALRGSQYLRYTHMSLFDSGVLSVNSDASYVLSFIADTFSESTFVIGTSLVIEFKSDIGKTCDHVV